MPHGSLKLRPIVDEDSPSLYTIVRGVVAEGDTYVYPTSLTSDEARAPWVEAPPGHTIVADEHDEIVGTAKFGPKRPGRGSHVATASFMVPTDQRGRGVGRALCNCVIAAARDEGYAGMQFNAVVATNVGAIELYRTLGFVTIGTVPGAFDHVALGPVGLDTMYLAL